MKNGGRRGPGPGALFRLVIAGGGSPLDDDASRRALVIGHIITRAPLNDHASSVGQPALAHDHVDVVFILRGAASRAGRFARPSCLAGFFPRARGAMHHDAADARLRSSSPEACPGPPRSARTPVVSRLGGAATVAGVARTGASACSLRAGSRGASAAGAAPVVARGASVATRARRRCAARCVRDARLGRRHGTVASAGCRWWRRTTARRDRSGSPEPAASSNWSGCRCFRHFSSTKAEVCCAELSSSACLAIWFWSEGGAAGACAAVADPAAVPEMLFRPRCRSRSAGEFAGPSVIIGELPRPCVPAQPWLLARVASRLRRARGSTTSRAPAPDSDCSELVINTVTTTPAANAPRTFGQNSRRWGGAERIAKVAKGLRTLKTSRCLLNERAVTSPEIVPC